MNVYSNVDKLYQLDEINQCYIVNFEIVTIYLPPLVIDGFMLELSYFT